MKKFINKIKNNVLVGKNKTLFTNIFSLTFLETINYIIPLLLIPFILRVFGVEKFGKYMFAQAFIQYFNIFIDFGFNFIATREISKNKENYKNVSKIFSRVILTKATIFIVSSIIFLAVINLFEIFNDKKLFLLCYIAVFGQLLFPLFLFQGLEKMKSMVFINVVPKLVILLIIFLSINNENDFYKFVLIFSLGYVLSGLIGFIYVLRMKYAKIEKITINEIKYSINESKDVFLANSASLLYLNTNTFILGIVSSSFLAVGYYAIAEKIVRVTRYAMNPISQALFPHYSERFSKQTFQESKRNIIKLAKIVTPFLVLLILLMLINIDFIVFFLNGSHSSRINSNVIIMSIIILIGTYNNLIGVLGYINLGLVKKYRNILILVGSFNLINVLTLGYFYNDIGASISLVLTEIILCIFLIRKFKEHD